MIKNCVNDSKATLDNSQINLIRKESKDSWYRYSYEDEGCLTPVSINDEMPLTLLDTNIKYRTVRNIKTKNLLETANTCKEDHIEDSINFDAKSKKASIRVQNKNDVQKWEEIDIQFKESDSSGSKLYSCKHNDVEANNSQDDGCYRMLHKMISNTLKHYKLDDVYSADDIIKIYEKNNMVAKYSKIATLDQDMRMLSSIIDFGEKPIHYMLNQGWKDNKLDGVKITEDGVLIPKKRPASALGLENQNKLTTESAVKKKAKKRNHEFLFMPPRPSDRLEVISYGEWSSRLKVELNEDNNVKLLEREVTVLDVEQTILGANNILKSLKGKVAKYDKLILLYVILGLILFGVVGFIFGFFVHFSISIVIGLIYFVILAFGVYFYKKWTKNLSIESHFWLALYLHWENFRHYLPNRIRLRPGFMAKWVEMYYLPLQNKK